MSKKQNRVSEAKPVIMVTAPKQGIYPSHLLKNVNPVVEKPWVLF